MMRPPGKTRSNQADAGRDVRPLRRRFAIALALGVLAAAGVAVASAAQRGPSRAAPTNLSLTSGLNSLTAAWGVTNTSSLAGFRVRWRLVTTPKRAWGKPIELGPAARSYSIGALAPGQYEFRVRSLIAAVRRTASGGRKSVRHLGALISGAGAALALPGETTPPVEAPKTEAPKEKAKELPKEELPKQEQPKQKEQPKEAPKEEAPKQEAPKEKQKEKGKTKEKEQPKEEPKEQPKEEPKKEEPKEEKPKEEPPKEEPPVEEPPVEEPPAEEGTGGVSCDLYGSPNGNDSAAGTKAAPMKTLHALFAKLKAGQSGCLLAGTYAALTLRSGDTHGSAGAPVTITSADPSEPATISGRMVTEPGASWLTFSHLHFTDSEVKFPSVTIGSAHTTWTDDDVTAPKTICFETVEKGQYGPGEDTLIERTRVHNCGQPYKCDSDSSPCNEAPNDGYFIHGLYDLGVRTTVRNSYFYEISSKGILFRGSEGSVVEHNVIDGDGSGVIYGDLSPENDIFRWNIVTNSHGVCGSCFEYYGIWSFGSVGAGNAATNNVLFGNVSGNVGPHNGVKVGENIEVDPKFVDAAMHDYTLELDSPALGYGPE